MSDQPDSTRRDVRYRSPECTVFLIRQPRKSSSLNQGDVIELASGSGPRKRSDVVECTTHKSISEPSGAFSFTLFPRLNSPIDYLNDIRSNDWVEIWMSDSSNSLELVMMGLVDRVNRYRVVGAKHEVQERVVVSGQDWGKVLLKTQTYFEAISGGVEEIVKLAQVYETLNDNTGKWVQNMGSPGAIVQQLFNIFSGSPDTLQFTYPITNAPFHALIYQGLIDTTTDVGYALTVDPPITGPDLWSMMDHYSHRLMNLFYCDTIRKKDAKASLTQPPPNPTISSPLTIGQSGEGVRFLQNMLKSVGAMSNKTPDGTFDAQTAQGVANYQDSRGISSTGLIPGAPAGNTVSPATWDQLSKEANTKTLDDPNNLPGIGIGFKGGGVAGDWIPALVLRKLPYSHQAFYSELVDYKISAQEVKTEDLGLADHEVFNFFRVIPQSWFGEGLDALEYLKENQLMLANPASISRAGIRRFEPTTPFVFPRPSLQGPTNPNQAISEYLYTVATWYSENEGLLSGTYNMATLVPRAKIGKRCVYDDPITGEHIESLTEAVTNHFSYPGPSTTAIAVTRGRNPTAWDNVRARELFEELGLSSAARQTLISKNIIPQDWETPDNDGQPAGVPVSQGVV